MESAATTAIRVRIVEALNRRVGAVRPRFRRSRAASRGLAELRPEPPFTRSGTISPKMVYRGGCVAEYAEYLERSPSTYDEQIGVAWPQEARKER
jgi:hypothetical protein